MTDLAAAYPYTFAVLEGRERWALVDEDCRLFLPKLPENSIDAIVTDPPAGIGFMDKEWDDPRKWDAFRRARNPNDAGRDSVFGRVSNHAPHSYGEGDRGAFVAWLANVMKEALRVLKPGGHALVWALPRTSHWTAWAIEDAGFEIRDVIIHHFGTGFPKSADVSKQIDKAAGAERKVVGTKLGLPGYSLAPEKHGKNTYNAARDGSLTNPEKECEITAPATEDAKHWSGWGTALKPASEHWILCRKPLSEKTVAANVLKWGTGALNIDRCRISVGVETIKPFGSPCKSIGGIMNVTVEPRSEAEEAASLARTQRLGRWPANLILSHNTDCKLIGTKKVKGITGTAAGKMAGKSTDVYGKFNGSARAGDPTGYVDADGMETVEDWRCTDDCPVAMLDRQSGESKSRAGKPRKSKSPGDGWGMTKTGAEYNDQGGASRFFYVAKASRGERDAGLEEDTKNLHPTIKPIDLMRYLCRLITPQGGLVLDPFAGSGSTGCAALLEGFRFVGIEREPEYCRIATARIAYWEKQKQAPAAQVEAQGAEAEDVA